LDEERIVISDALEASDGVADEGLGDAAEPPEPD